MPDVLCLGELLIDFVSTESGVTLGEAPAFKKAPGGAPANVAVGLARLGLSAGFMGKVGDDDFGHFLEQTLRQEGVDTTALCFSDKARTALAFVSLKADGERAFMFYRHPSADMLFEPDEVDVAAIQAARAFHFGSLTLIGEPAASATIHAVETAQAADRLISYDPNLRLSLWPGAEAAHKGMLRGWPYAALIKVSREELVFLSGEDDIEQGARRLWHPALRLLLVTDGAAGAYFVTPDGGGHVPGFPVEAVDTTGAGDGFMAGILLQVLGDPAILDELSRVPQAVRFANAVGALTTTERGAIPALPTREQVEALLAARKVS